MNNADRMLTVIGGSTLLFALALVTPASADPGRHNWQPHWDDRKPHEAQNHRNYRKRSKIFSGSRHYRYFGNEPDRYFGVGPGSYDCFGYDCTW